MKRSAVLGIALLGALGGSPVAAQQTGTMYRVGILSGRGPAAERLLVDAFLRTLSGLGYQEGKNLEIVDRTDDGVAKRLPDLATKLVRAKPDVIVCSGNLSIAAAQHATTSVPIVMAEVTDPIGSGYIASFARPGGNITGTAYYLVELDGKRLELLKELVPRLRRVVVLGDSSVAGNLAEWREAEKVARTSGIALLPIDIRSADQTEGAFKSISHLRADAIIVLPNGVMVNDAAHIVRLVAAQRLPAVYEQDAFIAAGGLMSFGASETGMWAKAATYVDRILKGAKPADLPVDGPTTFELVVNLKTARSLGITVPQSILLRADQVIR